MFVKLISKRGAYDELLALEEVRIMSASEQEVVQINEKTKRLVAIEKLKSKACLDEKLENSKDFARQVMLAQAEIASGRIKRWKERELKKVDDSLVDYQPTIDELLEEARFYKKPN